MSENILHWLGTAYSRISAGEAEANVLRDYGLIREEAFTIGVEHLRQENERLKAERDEVSVFGWETLEGFGRKRMRPLRRSSALNKQEFSEYLMFLETKCLDMGIVIPEPIYSEDNHALR